MDPVFQWTQPVAEPENLSLDEQLDEIIAAYLRSGGADQSHRQQRLLTAHPELSAELQTFFDAQARFQQMASPLREVFSAPRDCPAGSHIGDYEVLDEIARGGMGVVYKARHRVLGRIVALKMLRQSSLHSAADRQRFRIEVEAVANLDFPNIVPIYEVGEEDHPFFCMKWMPGGSLAERIAEFCWTNPNPPGATSHSSGAAEAGAHQRASGGPTGERKRRTLRLLIAVARAVHHAHTRGILHRDLKPANILLDADGTPYVSDFGLAKRFGPRSLASLPDSCFLAADRLGADRRDAQLHGPGTGLWKERCRECRLRRVQPWGHSV
jgi:serine/threonine protein kinase